MCSRPRWWAKQTCAAVPGGVGLRPDQVDAGAVPVVVDGLLDPVAVGVELGPDVGQRVPLGRVLQRQRHHVVGPHVDVPGSPNFVHLAHVDVVEGAGVALHVLGRREHRRVAALVQGRAAGVVERQAQAEADAGLDLAHALEDLLGGEQVDAAELVVVAPVAPGRAGRALLPPLRHGRFSFWPRRTAAGCPRCLYRPVGLHFAAQGTACAHGRSGRSTDLASQRRKVTTMTEKQLVVSADGHILEPTDLFVTRLPKHLRDRGVWEDDFEIEPLVEGGARIFRRLHTPGFEGWTISRYRQTGGRMPEGDPEMILEDLALDGVDVGVMHPNLSLFGLYSDDHELSMAHARVYNDYIIERFTPYFARLAPTAPIPLTDVDDAVAEIERVAAGGFRAILLPATPPKPYYSRDFDPVWAAAQANGVHVFIHTQTGGVKVNDPESTTLKVVMENAEQVNQPMTEKAASKRMITQCDLQHDRPPAGHLPAHRRWRARALPGPPLRPDRVQRPLAGVAGGQHGQVLGHRDRPGRRLVARRTGTTAAPPTSRPAWPSCSG